MFTSLPNPPGLLLLVLLFTCISCRQGNRDPDEAVSRQQPDSAENLAKSPLASRQQVELGVFPFGQELSTFNISQTLKNEAGDCSTSMREFGKDSLRIVTDSTNCFEYGVHNQYYFFRKDIVEQVHIFEYFSQYDPSGENVTYVATETVYALSENPPRSYVRTDTLIQPEHGQMQSDFEAELIPDPAALIEDLRVQLASLEKAGEDPYGFNIKASQDTEGNGMIPPTDIYLYATVWKDPVWLSREPSMSRIPQELYSANGIPKAAAFAFNSWYAGGGHVYYGLVEGSELMVYRRFEEEQQGSENNFRLFKMIALQQKSPSPAYYICYRNDDNMERELMVAFSDSDTALWAQYKGAKDSVTLVEKEKKITTSGAAPLVQNSYGAFEGNSLIGTITLTHSGTWDYALISNRDSIEDLRFTIKHEASTDNNGYRSSPCF